MDKSNRNIRKDILRRVFLVYGIMLLFAIVIIARTIYIQVAEGDIWREKANNYALKNIIIEPNRGDICSIDGRILACSVPYYDIRMDLNSDALDAETFSNNIDSLSFSLSRLFKDKTKSQYKKELVNARKKKSRYHLIQKRVTYLKLKELKTFPLFRLGQFKGGLIVEQDNRRIKPFLNLASRTLGYLSKDETMSIVGLEGAYDKYLRGIQGVKLMQKISGNVWKEINDGNEVEPVHGDNLITAIDINYQDVAENALMKNLQLHEADHGCAILMEVKTGEIKAIANLKRNENGNYYETYNYAIGESTEPGSTFKLASLMVALDEGRINLKDSVETGNGIIKYYDLTMRDTKPHGKITVQEAFEISSNVGVSKIIVKTYSENPLNFVDKLYRMNLNDKLNLEIKGEGKPLIKYPGDSLWSGVTLPQMSIGYEVSLTPLQILTFYNAVANDGKMVRPLFVKYLCHHGDTTKVFETEIINPSICSYETIKKVKIMLEGVVERGTAKNLKNNNYKVAGKTGTAQIAKTKHGYGIKKSYLASFVGYFPADNPKYSCIVVVHSPAKDVYYGSSVAGPIFKEIADKVYATSLDIHPDIIYTDNYIDIPKCKDGFKFDILEVLNNLKINSINKSTEKSQWISILNNDTLLTINNKNIADACVPNVKGMSIKDAIFLLENIGLKVDVYGKGAVRNQSLEPGQEYNTGDLIIIELG